ncbi:retrovirus-related pol polyprotein from transposon TNT 1-94 [Tanacetum coccineum]
MGYLIDSELASLFDSPDDEEDTRSSHEYLNDLEEEYQARALLAKSKRFFKKGTHRPTKDFEAKYNQVKAKLALLSSNAPASKASMVKNKGLIAEAYEWDEEEVSSDNNEMVEVKVLMALADRKDDSCRQRRTHIEAARTMLSGSVFSKQYWTEAVATACYTQNRFTIMKRHLKTPYEIFHKRIPNISFLHVFGCTVYIHNHKDHLGKFDEKVDDVYLLGYSLVSKVFRVFNTRRQKTEETYHITFNESPNAIKFSKPLVDNINIAKNERFPPDECLHPYEPSKRYQTNSNNVSFIEPYECPKPVVLETEVSSDQNGQTDQNDQSVQNDEILNDDHFEHSNHTNDEQIIDNLPNTEDIQISKHSSSPRVKDTSVQNTILIPNPPLPIPSVVTPAPQDIWSQDKHIKLVNIINFLSEEEPKKVSEALKHPGWVDAMQDELNQFARNKFWILVLAPYDKTIIGSKWVFRNKRDETGIVIKNKARLVA